MLSVVIITRNEESMITDCLVSVQFVDEIIVVDTGNTDQTNAIAKKQGAQIIKSIGKDYSAFRNTGLKAASGDWILYVDADERVTPALREELLRVIKSEVSMSAYAILRKNIFLGKHLHHGGWGGDYVIRLFKKAQLKGYRGVLHEQPEFIGDLAKLSNELVHLSHRDLTSMLNKTLEFTSYEAKLRLLANHPRMTWWRFVRVMLSEFWLRFIKLAAWRDGVEGIIDGLFQVFNSFIIYARLWELQHDAKSHST